MIHMSFVVREIYKLINNDNKTEWSAIWSEIICMISRSNEQAA